jgi:hypothetical protein
MSSLNRISGPFDGMGFLMGGAKGVISKQRV